MKAAELINLYFLWGRKAPRRATNDTTGHKLHSDLEHSVCTSRVSAFSARLPHSSLKGHEDRRKCVWGTRHHVSWQLRQTTPPPLFSWPSAREVLGAQSHARNSAVAFPSLTTSQSCQFICSLDFLLSTVSLSPTKFPYLLATLEGGQEACISVHVPTMDLRNI